MKAYLTVFTLTIFHEMEILMTERNNIIMRTMEASVCSTNNMVEIYVV